MAIRIVRGYRTISLEAATVLARFPPLDILAEMDAWVYTQIRAHCQGEETAPIAHEVLRRRARQAAHEAWRERLEEPRCSRQRVVRAILPSLEAWLKREGVHVTYRLTQILTGHGCFSEYLNRIGREATTACHHCGDDRDDAQHTLAACPAWHRERRALILEVGQDLTLSAIVAAMLSGQTAWDAVVAFCEAVMLQKEAAERDRERADPSRRRTRRGRSDNRLVAPVQLESGNPLPN